jgi:hypothetical protein
MKVTARGSRRNCGPWTLKDADLRDDDVWPDDDGVRIGFERGCLTLHGDYHFSVALSRRDVARLFAEAFPDFKTAATLLTCASARTTSDQVGLPSDAAA